MRALGLFLLLIGSLAMLGERLGLAFPTARWFFETSRQIPWLHADLGTWKSFPWFGWLSAALLLAVGLWLALLRPLLAGPPNPVTLRRLKRFRQIRRGYYSLWLLIGLALLATLDQSLVGKRALAVKFQDRWVFPAFLPTDLKNRDFGITSDAPDAPVDYRKLRKQLKANGLGTVVMPLIPYDPTGDTLPARSRPLVERDGLFYEAGSSKPFWGLAVRYHDADAGRMHLRLTMRNGIPNGPVDGWAADGTPMYSATWKENHVSAERYSGQGTAAEFLKLTQPDALRAVKYHPAPPIPEEGNWLGTTSQGYDLLAYLYGGLQVNFKAALIYLPVIYVIGISLGLLMGYFGGWFDLAVQRLIEIFSNIPFLFVVIIISNLVPDSVKGLPVILSILALFGWMGMTFLMRTAAYRDKQRDYIAAARVIGASTPRVLFRHLLPNTVAILVTLVPFTVSGLIFALTSLDYLGFGLPPEYATWGRLLQDGLSNLSAPWLVSSTFFVLVSLLVLITFVGEAVREAFDPKPFTYYR